MWVWWHYSAFGSATIIVQVGHVDAVAMYSSQTVVGMSQPGDAIDLY